MCSSPKNTKSVNDILDRAIRVAGHADQFPEPLLRCSGKEIDDLIAELKGKQKLIDKELTRRHRELAEKGAEV